MKSTTNHGLTFCIPEGRMDAPHEAHLNRIIEQLSGDVRAKYEAGQREHGGNLWEKPGMLEQAIAEVLDLAVYLYTLKEQRDRHLTITGRD
jgi:hypothetical protein